MDIIEALKNENYDLRIINNDKWMCFYNGYWIVYQRKYRHQITRTLITTEHQIEAIKILLGEN